jgi:hypothetical protein
MEARDMQVEVPIEALRRQILERLESVETKRRALTKKLSLLKFLRVLCGVLSIAFVSAIGTGSFGGSIQQFLALSAVVTTTVSAFSSDLLDAFGYEERLKQNIRSVSSIKSILNQLDLDVSVRSSDGTLNGIDYWGYQGRLNTALSAQNDSWQKAMSNQGK